MNTNNSNQKPTDKDNQSLKEYRELLDEASYRRISPANGVEAILLQDTQPDFLEAINRERDRIQNKDKERNEHNASNEG